jgi:hypothetical protein
MKSAVEAALKKRYPPDIVDKLLAAYREIEENYVLRKWKASELDAGHFVEAVRRVLEQELLGAHTPIATQLSQFTDQVLKQYENAAGDESFRMLIPRALKSIFNVRNKRGIGHLGGFEANEMDATYILYTVKWVLAELVRIASGSSVGDAQRLVEQIVERKMELIWTSGDVMRVLDPKMATREQVLVLLSFKSPRTDTELQKAIGYSNSTNFRKILKRLDKDALIHYDTAGTCTLLPTGHAEAEAIALEHRQSAGAVGNRRKKKKKRRKRLRRSS